MHLLSAAIRTLPLDNSDHNPALLRVQPCTESSSDSEDIKEEHLSLSTLKEHKGKEIPRKTTQETPLEHGANETVTSIPKEEQLLRVRVAFANALAKREEAKSPTHVVVCATICGSKAFVSDVVLPWILYHTELGVRTFFLSYDGNDVPAVRLLQQLQNVQVRPLHEFLPREAETSEMAIYRHVYKNYTPWKGYAGRPGNYQLMVKQIFGSNQAIAWARDANATWIMQMDPDEYIVPPKSHASFAAYLDSRPSSVSQVQIKNVEAQAEHPNVTDPVRQVTLFKTNRHQDTQDQRRVREQTNAWTRLYTNGKAVARVDTPGLVAKGPHRFRWIESNRTKHTVARDLRLLHYTYTRPNDVRKKAKTSCPPEYRRAALAGNTTQLKDCFIFALDSQAFVAAVTEEEKDNTEPEKANNIVKWYTENLMLHNATDQQMASALELGVLVRETAVQRMARKHEQIVGKVHGIANTENYSSLASLQELVEQQLL